MIEARTQRYLAVPVLRPATLTAVGESKPESQIEVREMPLYKITELGDD